MLDTWSSRRRSRTCGSRSAGLVRAAVTPPCEKYSKAEGIDMPLRLPAPPWCPCDHHALRGPTPCPAAAEERPTGLYRAATPGLEAHRPCWHDSDNGAQRRASPAPCGRTFFTLQGSTIEVSRDRERTPSHWAAQMSPTLPTYWSRTSLSQLKRQCCRRCDRD